MTQIKHTVTLNKIVQSFNDRHVLDKISTKLNQIYDIGLVIQGAGAVMETHL